MLNVLSASYYPMFRRPEDLKQAEEIFLDHPIRDYNGREIFSLYIIELKIKEYLTTS